MLNLKTITKNFLHPLYPLTNWIEDELHIVNEKLSPIPQPFAKVVKFSSIEDIRQATLSFAASLRVTKDGHFLGYRFANETRSPLLYCTLAVLLLKHIYRVEDESIENELARVLSYQSDDGLFRDPAIACPTAEREDWWGWRHLTLHSLMTLALYGKQTPHRQCYLDRFLNRDYLWEYLNKLNWDGRAAWTSNEVQNLGVMLQYARDYQEFSNANELLGIIFDAIKDHQNIETGLHGDRFDTPEKMSSGMQASYHFWLLYAYDHRPIPNVNRVVESALLTQNIRGGYSAHWHSSACEDIDSIDTIVRFGCYTDIDTRMIRASLQRALSSILTNINADGGWVFRRDEPLVLPHPEMCSPINKSNIFYTWFRTLALAYCLIGLDKECPKELRYDWNIGWAPGHHLAIEDRFDR